MKKTNKQVRVKSKATIDGIKMAKSAGLDVIYDLVEQPNYFYYTDGEDIGVCFVDISNTGATYNLKILFKTASETQNIYSNYHTAKMNSSLTKQHFVDSIDKMNHTELGIVDWYADIDEFIENYYHGEDLVLVEHKHLKDV